MKKLLLIVTIASHKIGCNRGDQINKEFGLFYFIQKISKKIPVKFHSRMYV